MIEKQRAIPRGRPSERMAGGVSGEIGFCFDDATAQAAARKFANNRFSDQEARELDGIGRKLRAANSANVFHLVPVFTTGSLAALR